MNDEVSKEDRDKVFKRIQSKVSTAASWLCVCAHAVWEHESTIAVSAAQRRSMVVVREKERFRTENTKSSGAAVKIRTPFPTEHSVDGGLLEVGETSHGEEMLFV